MWPLVRAVSLILFIAACGGVQAQIYPGKPVKIIVPGRPSSAFNKAAAPASPSSFWLVTG